MKKTKNKNLRRTLGLIALAALVALLSVMPLLASKNAPEEEYPLSILSAQTETMLPERSLRAGGVLTAEEGESVSVPSQVKLTEFLVRNGDYVQAGDPIAKVDRVTVMQAIAETQEAMADLEKDLEKARTSATTATVTAPAGYVKAVYAQSGDLVSEVMLEYGCLALVSLDNRMVLEVQAETDLAAGDPVTVTVNGEEVAGTVKLNRTGTLTVTIPDQGYDEGTPAKVSDADGNPIGEGLLYVHAPWRAVAYQGTVNTVSAKPGQKLYNNAALMTLKDLGHSAEYRSLAAQHREYEEQMLDLFQLYQNLTLTAPCDGMVSGIDTESAQLLRSQGTWELTLLANAPNGDDSKSYFNFVGQVVAIGSDGYVVRLNPQFLNVSDYTDLSAVPRDTAAMTYDAVYSGGAPVYQWNGQSWGSGSFGIGSVVLFSGDDSGQIVWVIPLGSAPLPDGSGTITPSEPTDPTDPSDPSGPSEPSDPTDPSDPTGPSWPSRPTEPSQPPASSEPTEPSGTTDPTVPSIPGGLPGGITLPSFGGYGGFGGYGNAPQEEEAYGTDTVEVALVTPQNTMTLPVTVDELDLHLVSLGQRVNITVDALVGSTFEGTVTKISQAGQNTGGSSKFTVTVTLQQAANMLAGMNAAVTIPLGEEQGLCIPVAALYQEGVRTLVYTALDAETGEPTTPVEVQTGYSDGEFVVVTGLEAGTTVYYGYYEALESAELPAMPPMMPMGGK